MDKTSEFLTVGELLEQLKDIPKDYLVSIAQDCGWSYCFKSIRVDNEDKEVVIFDYC